MRLVNLVGTRGRDGDAAALRRWYADHVHQLFAFDGLLEARLLAREGAGQGAAPECLCLYDFAGAAAFAEYEAGPVHAAAAADRALGWGRDGIEIVMRQAYTRLYRRTAPAPAAPRCSVTALQVGADAERALAATMDGALELYRAAAEPMSLLLLAERAAVHDAMQWQADYALLLHWTR
jgi:hypothetical protein